MEKFDATLVIMAAGMGSRFGGLKQVEPVGKHGEAIVDFSVFDAKRAGFNKVVFVIKSALEKEFRDIVGRRVEKQIDVDYVCQELDNIPAPFKVPEGRQKPWGTGQAVLCCRDTVKTPFSVINADDFYGAGAFRQVYDSLKNDKEHYCMVGFRLGNTLTENGTVSRGICSVEDGFLVGVDERTAIDNRCRYTEDNGENWIQMDPNTVVSMNMWGFSTNIFNYLEEGFVSFLKEKGNQLKTEFYVPILVDELIKTGKEKVRVKIAEDRWYGVTYKEDKAAVVKALSAMPEYDNIYR